MEGTWRSLVSELSHDDRSDGAICVKPSSDGCSTGVARLETASDFKAYIKVMIDHFLHEHKPGIKESVTVS